MRRGELAQLTIAPELGYGASGSPPAIPGNATLVFDIELLSFGPKPREPWEMTAAERLAGAEAAKARGNSHAKDAAAAAEALAAYDEAVTLLTGLEASDPGSAASEPGTP